MRAKALLLLSVLLMGGFGLPTLDALWFHATIRAPVTSQTALTQAEESGPAHLLGCAVWSSPAASTGLPCVTSSTIGTVTAQVDLPARPGETFRHQTLPTLALPRASPSA
jgi:hypothetical protein